jgi:hypothetical protein
MFGGGEMDGYYPMFVAKLAKIREIMGLIPNFSFKN